MPDNLLLTVFGFLTIVGLAIGGVAVHFALKCARTNDSELKMAFWAFVALAGLTVAGMSCAYFVIPILANHIF